MLIKWLKAVANGLGVDLIRINASPRITWLGLRGRDIRYIIDVGANIGQFAMEAHRAFSKAVFLCFEPIPEVASRLEANVLAMKIRAHVERMALSDKVGKALFRVHVDHSTSSSLLETTHHTRDLYPKTARQRSIDVRTSTLDAVMANYDTSSCHEILLKLDTQGNEVKILEGAVNSLSFIDHVMIEVNIDILYKGQASFIEIHKIMSRYGFHYAGALSSAYGNNGQLIFFDALFTKMDL